MRRSGYLELVSSLQAHLWSLPMSQLQVYFLTFIQFYSLSLTLHLVTFLHISGLWLFSVNCLKIGWTWPILSFETIMSIVEILELQPTFFASVGLGQVMTLMTISHSWKLCVYRLVCISGWAGDVDTPETCSGGSHNCMFHSSATWIYLFEVWWPPPFKWGSHLCWSCPWKCTSLLR